MKKSRKILYVLPLLAILLGLFIGLMPNVQADVTNTFPEADGKKIDTIDNMAKSVWGTVLNIVQILAFAAVVFAGVRYMFASADQKADIKKGLIYLVIGAVLVFAASAVIKLILDATEAAGLKSQEQVEIVERIEA